ncbi:MAG: RNA-binding S4 domain-containing protein [Clostridiales bacterium]|nr:RNA-binding S4 domain-containing protein [Clostridiales bacterium]
MKEIKIDKEFIKLDQLLKYANIADTGGHAKIMILDGSVMVNDKIVTQRGKKIRPGDIVKVDDIEIRVI